MRGFAGPHNGDYDMLGSTLLKCIGPLFTETTE